LVTTRDDSGTRPAEGAPESVRTLADLPFHLDAHCRKPVLLRRCRPDGFDDYSTRDVYERVRDLNVGLAGLGFQSGDRLALISESRPEWGFADLATLTAGGVTVPIYPTQSATQVGYILRDCGATVAVVSNAHQVDKVQQVRAEAPALQVIVVIDGEGHRAPGLLPVFSMAEVVARGGSTVRGDHTAEDAYRSRARSIDPQRLATIVYTSGTTGEPKGVMLSHGNLLSNARATEAVLPMTSVDVMLSFLPLSHAFERLAFFRALCNGATMAFAESLSTVARDLVRVRPTVMTGVPRFYEKFLAAILDGVAKQSPVRQRLFRWARALGEQAVEARERGERVSMPGRLGRVVADALVYRKIRARTGGRLRYLVSGSAPLSRPVGVFFLSIGLPIIEGYGLTETSPVVTANSLEAMRIGTVGHPLEGIEIRLAADGGIATRGPNVMAGYYGKPALTAEVLRDGWFYTGDVGAIDADGFLTITDRKKDLIVTSGGKKIAPQPLEAGLKQDRLVAEAVVIGESRKFPAVLIVPNFELLDLRARSLGLAGLARRDQLAAPEVRALYQQLVDRVNAGLGQYERIKKFALLPSEFTMERDELTPTMKVRRKVVEDRWRDVIDEMYKD
jgi:long-chain acyl-CoA synthetase